MLELGLGVVVEPIRHAEPVAQRAGDAADARRGADDRHVLDLEPHGASTGALAEDHVEGEVLHRRVEDLLDHVAEPMDLVDEQHVALPVQLVRTAARSPARSMAGPEVVRIWAPISAATMFASVVLPRPGGP